LEGKYAVGVAAVQRKHIFHTQILEAWHACFMMTKRDNFPLRKLVPIRSILSHTLVPLGTSTELYCPGLFVCLIFNLNGVITDEIY